MTDYVSPDSSYIVGPDDYCEALRPNAKRRLNSIVSVRFTAEEVDILRTAAGDQGLSTFIRQTALKEAQAPAVGQRQGYATLTWGTLDQATIEGLSIGQTAASSGYFLAPLKVPDAMVQRAS